MSAPSEEKSQQESDTVTILSYLGRAQPNQPQSSPDGVEKSKAEEQTAADDAPKTVLDARSKPAGFKPDQRIYCETHQRYYKNYDNFQKHWHWEHVGEAFEIVISESPDSSDDEGPQAPLDAAHVVVLMKPSPFRPHLARITWPAESGPKQAVFCATHAKNYKTHHSFAMHWYAAHPGEHCKVVPRDHAAAETPRPRVKRSLAAEPPDTTQPSDTTQSPDATKPTNKKAKRAEGGIETPVTLSLATRARTPWHGNSIAESALFVASDEPVADTAASATNTMTTAAVADVTTPADEVGTAGATNADTADAAHIESVIDGAAPADPLLPGLSAEEVASVAAPDPVTNLLSRLEGLRQYHRSISAQPIGVILAAELETVPADELDARLDTAAEVDASLAEWNEGITRMFEETRAWMSAAKAKITTDLFRNRANVGTLFLARLRNAQRADSSRTSAGQPSAISDSQ